MVGRRILLLTAICSLLLWRGASAHAQLVLAEPTNGATLDEVKQIHLTFNENLGDDNSVILIGENFARIAGVEVREVVFNEIFVSVPELEPGVYTVQYDVTSEDGHPISGSYEFAVQPPPADNSLLVGIGFGALASLGVVAFLIYRRRQTATAE